VRGPIDGLQITAGHLGNFFHSSSVSRLGISVAGTLTAFVVRGNVGQTIADPATGNPIPDSYIQATGTSGSISNFFVIGSLFANVTANASIGLMTIVHDVQGSITVNGQTTGLAMGTLRIGGALRNGALSINGNVGSIITSYGIGSPGGTWNITGHVNQLMIGTSRSATNVLALNLHAQAGIGTMTVFGRVDGNVTIDSDLNALRLVATAPGNVLNGNFTVGGRLNSATVIGGHIAGSITVNSTIGGFLLSRGSVLAGSTISSQLGSIQSFRIIGGPTNGLFGNLVAGASQNGIVDISGNVGDGVNPAGITEGTGNSFHVHGSIRTGATVNLFGQLNLLTVDGNIDGGSFVAAHPLKRLVVHGSNSGTVTQV
jgi:hypothetical protein